MASPQEQTLSTGDGGGGGPSSAGDDYSFSPHSLPPPRGVKASSGYTLPLSGTAAGGRRTGTTGTNTATAVVRRAGRTVTKHVEEGAKRTSDHWKVLTFGQALSFLRFVIGASATVLFRYCGLNVPATQTGVAYYMMLLVHGPRFFFPRTFGCGNKDGGGDGSKSGGGGGGGSGKSGKFEDDIADDAASKSRRGWFPVPLHASLLAYFLIALLHVEGNYLVFLSLRYTTFTSVTLFVNLAVPSAMAFSRLLLRRRYKASHLLGAFVCLSGVLLNAYADYAEQLVHRHESGADDVDSEDEFGEAAVEEYPHRMLGDALAIIGGILFGVNDALFERAVRTYGGGPREFLPMLGLFGAAISTIQVLAFELPDLAEFSSQNQDAVGATAGTDATLGVKVVEDVSGGVTGGSSVLTPHDEDIHPVCTTNNSLALLLAGGSLSTYLLVAGVSHFLTASESALLNLSYLTEDWYSVLFSVAAVGYVPPRLFYLALVLVLFGVFLYETGPSPADDAAAFAGKEVEEEGGGTVLESPGPKGREGGADDDGLAAVAAGSFTTRGGNRIPGGDASGGMMTAPKQRELPDVT